MNSDRLTPDRGCWMTDVERRLVRTAPCSLCQSVAVVGSAPRLSTRWSAQALSSGFGGYDFLPSFRFLTRRRPYKSTIESARSSSNCTSELPFQVKTVANPFDVLGRFLIRSYESSHPENESLKRPLIRPRACERRRTTSARNKQKADSLAHQYFKAAIVGYVRLTHTHTRYDTF